MEIKNEKDVAGNEAQLLLLHVNSIQTLEEIGDFGESKP